MKTIPGIILSLGLILCGVRGTNAQPGYRLIPDSTYTYTFSTVSNSWDFAGASYSYYISGLLDSTVTADHNRIPIGKSIYTYDDGVISEATSLVATNGSMVQSQHEVFYYDAYNLLTERLVTKWIGGNWQNLNWFRYIYDDKGRLLVYDRDFWTAGGWVDFSADSLFYDESSRLFKRSAWSIPNDKYITRSFYTYNPFGKRIYQIRQDYINDKWVNIRRTNYQYNNCGTQTGTVTGKWTNGAWQNDSKTTVFYHYTLADDRKKIPVCHQGHTITVLGETLALHLGHGDCLGSCIGDNSIPVTKSADTGLTNKSVPFIVYPNPATDRVTIKMKETDCPVSSIELIDFSGRVIRSVSPGDQIETTIYLTNLRSGNYILRVTSNMIYSTIISRN